MTPRADSYPLSLPSPRTKRIRSAVLWQGSSPVDGAPLVVIATTDSTNVKTGNMAQTYILRADMAPHHAVATGADASTCGDCAMRPVNARPRGPEAPVCYVDVGKSVRATWASWRAGRKPLAPAGWLASLNIPVRLGTYGDPSMVPFDVWARLLAGVKRWTGYTHQSNQPWYDARMGTIVMVSADSVSDAIEARDRFHRSFRVRPVDPRHPDHALLSHEIACPASDEAGKRTTCDRCGLCDGARDETDGRRSIAILAHDPRSRAAARRLAVLQ